MTRWYVLDIADYDDEDVQRNWVAAVDSMYHKMKDPAIKSALQRRALLVANPQVSFVFERCVSFICNIVMCFRMAKLVRLLYVHWN